MNPALETAISRFNQLTVNVIPEEIISSAIKGRFIALDTLNENSSNKIELVDHCRGFLYAALHFMLIQLHRAQQDLQSHSEILRARMMEYKPIQILNYKNKALDYLSTRWFSTLLINIGLGNIVWLFSELRWTKITETSKFLSHLENKVENPNDRYQEMKANIDRSISLKNNSIFSANTVPEEPVNDGNWSEIFNRPFM
jgi:hypothetical protein